MSKLNTFISYAAGDDIKYLLRSHVYTRYSKGLADNAYYNIIIYLICLL